MVIMTLDNFFFFFQISIVLVLVRVEVMVFTDSCFPYISVKGPNYKLPTCKHSCLLSFWGRCLGALNSDTLPALWRGMVKASPLLPAQMESATRLLISSLWIQSCGRLAAVHMLSSARAHLLILWVPERTRHWRVNTLCWQHFPQNLLDSDFKTAEGRKPSLHKIRKCPASPVIVKCMVCPVPEDKLDLETSWSFQKLDMQIRSAWALVLRPSLSFDSCPITFLRVEHLRLGFVPKEWQEA